MLIRLLDPDNDREISALYASYRASHHADNPRRPLWPESQMIADIRDPIGEEVVPLVAYDEGAGALLGGALVALPLRDNLEKAYLELFVSPGHRNRGVGGALVEEVVERVRAAGRDTLLADASYGFEHREDHPYRRFAHRHGFALASTEVWRTLELPVPDARVQEWIDETKDMHRDYRLETFHDDDIPDALLPSLCSAFNQLAADAPSGDIDFEPEGFTPEDFVRRRERNQQLGTSVCTTLALDADGVAAVTVIGVHANDDGRAHQWTTIVLGPHRGHRLGLALKARNLRALQERHPDRTSVHTTNAEVNGPMIAINERMGFEPVELVAEFQRTLAA